MVFLGRLVDIILNNNRMGYNFFKFLKRKNENKENNPVAVFGCSFFK